MKAVIYEDSNGMKHRAFLPDGADFGKPELGLPADPPDLSMIDWEEVQKGIHNMLVARGLFTIKDIEKPHSGLQNAIVLAIMPQIVKLYKFREVQNE